jgi:hypothetical protein
MHKQDGIGLGGSSDQPLAIGTESYLKNIPFLTFARFTSIGRTDGFGLSRSHKRIIPFVPSQLPVASQCPARLNARVFTSAASS